MCEWCLGLFEASALCCESELDLGVAVDVLQSLFNHGTNVILELEFFLHSKTFFNILTSASCTVVVDHSFLFQPLVTCSL